MKTKHFALVRQGHRFGDLLYSRTNCILGYSYTLARDKSDLFPYIYLNRLERKETTQVWIWEIQTAFNKFPDDKLLQRAVAKAIFLGVRLSEWLS